MSGRRSISNSFNVITVDEPVSVIAQYAPTDNPSSSQIHDTWQNGDLYMRTKSTEEGSTWSSWHKIVGESGGETNYKFGISAQKTTASSTTAPTLKPNTTWSDAPVQIEADYPYLWSKVQKKDGNGNDVGVASYIRLNGEDGEDGDDGVSYCFVFTKAAARVNEDNIVTAELAGYAYKYVGGVRSALTSTSIRYGYILNDPSTYADTTTNASGFFDADTWFNGDDITDYGKNSPSIFAAIVIGGTVVHAEMITISIKGRTGSRGKVGRFFYYAGAFNVSDSTTQFLVNDAQSPYFSYNNQYWVYNPEYNPSGGYATMAQMGAPSSSSANWKIMTNDFKYIITEAIFGSYAHFGSFIINGDWMISQHGTINGQASTNYTQFDPDHPNDNTGTNFIPNFAVDGLTGKTYQNDAYIRGEVSVVSEKGRWNIKPDYHQIGRPSIVGLDSNDDEYMEIAFDSDSNDNTRARDGGGLYFYNMLYGNDYTATRYCQEAWRVNCRDFGTGGKTTHIEATPQHSNPRIYFFDNYNQLNRNLTIGINTNGAYLLSSNWMSKPNAVEGETYVDAWGNMKVKNSLSYDQFNVRTGSFQLPYGAPVNTVFFCKGLDSDMTVTTSGWDVIMNPDDRGTTQSMSFYDKSVFFVKMAQNTWVTFWSE